MAGGDNSQVEARWDSHIRWERLRMRQVKGIATARVSKADVQATVASDMLSSQ